MERNLTKELMELVQYWLKEEEKDAADIYDELANILAEYDDETIY